MIPESHADEPLRFFKELYAVVVGVGLALAAEQLVDLDKTGVPVRWEDVPLFVSWIAVALPFAHVFVRYLDFAFGRHAEGASGRGLAFGNIFFGAVHYIGLIALALFLSRPLVFGWTLVIFVGVVLIRDAFLRLHPRGWLADVERRVTAVFLWTEVGWLVGLLVAQAFFDGSARDWFIRGVVLAVSLVFAFGIYVRAYDFFFGTGPSARGRVSG